MRVFITGASGFVGAHAVDQILTAGHEVAILAVPEDPLARLEAHIQQLTVLRAYLTDRPAVSRFLDDFRPDICIHLAWYAEPGKYLDSPENVPTLINSIMLLEELIRVQCEQVVMVGSCAEYDTDVGLLRENSPTRPTTIYAAAKLSMALIGEQMAASAGIQFAWARLFYLYGNMEDERRMVPALIRALLKGQRFPATPGDQVRDYLHVEDIASAIWHIAENKLSGIYNVSSGTPITIRHLMELIGRTVGRVDLIDFGSIPYRQWEPMFICGDNTKLKQTGWKPRYALSDGIADNVAWWERQLKQ